MLLSRQDANTTQWMQERVVIVMKTKKVCRLRPTLLLKVATMNRTTLVDPTNLGNTPTNDLANDFATIGIVHKTMIVL